VLGLFFDTQFEHPLTYQHVDKLKTLYNVNIVKITNGSVPEIVRKYKKFPSGVARHCTWALKMVPAKRFYKSYAEENGPFEVWLGIRSEESVERSKRYSAVINTELYPPNDIFPSQFPKYLEKMGVMFRFPILDWKEDQVYSYLNGEENPLYRNGFDRVGCFPCLAGGDKSKETAFEFDTFGKSQYQIVKSIEDDIGVSVWRSKYGKDKYHPEMNDGSGCAYCSI